MANAFITMLRKRVTEFRFVYKIDQMKICYFGSWAAPLYFLLWPSSQWLSLTYLAVCLYDQTVYSLWVTENFVTYLSLVSFL